MEVVNLRKLKEEVPFDQFSRQYVVLSVLSELRIKGEKRFTILDVGGYKGRTAEFLSGDSVTVLDLYDAPDENYVKGNALDMDFPAKSFDFVVSFDVLEHIPADKRERFFDECSRVARQGVIICAPQKTVANQYAESSLNGLYMKLHHEPHQWLREHIEFGIPDFDNLESYARKNGMATIRFPSNKVQLWTAMQDAIFINSKYPLAAQKLVDINKFYNEHFYFDGGGAEVAAYRLILCSFWDIAKADKLRRKSEVWNGQIDPDLEVQLYEKLADFSYTLVQKTDALAADYKGLYEQEKAIGEQLHAENARLEQELRRARDELSRTLDRRLKGLIQRKGGDSGTHEKISK